MFKPLSMQHVSLWVLNADAPQASLLLATYGIFTPEKSQAWERELPDTPGDRYAEVFAEANARLHKILEHYGPAALAGCGGMSSTPAGAIMRPPANRSSMRP